MDELLAIIEKDWRLFMKFDPTIRSLASAVNSGTATYAQAHAYAIRVGEILHGCVEKHITDATELTAEAIEGLLKPLLKDNAADIAAICEKIQNSINDAAEISLRAQAIGMPASRIDGITKAALKEDGLIGEQLKENIIQLGQSIVDSSIQANAEFLDDVGLKGVIIRQTEPYATGTESRPTGGRKKPRTYSMPCKWCQGLAGKYAYGTEPNEVYHRHSGCRCITDYVVGKKKQDVWSKAETIME